MSVSAPIMPEGRHDRPIYFDLHYHGSVRVLRSQHRLESYPLGHFQYRIFKVACIHTFTLNCHLGKTHSHRSRGDTTWKVACIRVLCLTEQHPAALKRESDLQASNLTFHSPTGTSIRPARALASCDARRARESRGRVCRPRASTAPQPRGRRAACRRFRLPRGRPPWPSLGRRRGVPWLPARRGQL
jgi:hypothetical protein